MVANFAFIEMVEQHVVKKPISVLVSDAIAGTFSVIDMIDVVDCAIKANKDTRLSREEVGEELIKKGVIHFTKTYVDLLTFAITGEKELKPKMVKKTDKKK